MSDWRTRLKDADAARQRETSAEEVEKIRSIVLAAVHHATTTRMAVWLRPVVVAAALLVFVVAGLTAVLRTHRVPSSAEPMGASADVPQTTTDRQQLQFATPGGTRIIWVFDPNFEVKGTLP